MNWKYKNNNNYPIIWGYKLWEPEKELETSYPVPAFVGLTCTQTGDVPDPVTFHDDIIVQPGETVQVDIEGSGNIALSVFCMTAGQGVECRFNSLSNKPIPIDVRGFTQTLPWISCSQLFLTNPGIAEAHISVSAVEVVS